MADVPDVRYARSGGVAIAYQVVGEGSQDLVFLPFLSNLVLAVAVCPPSRRGAGGSPTSSRLIVVNTRGMGLSDRPRGLTIEARMDDVRAVMDDRRQRASDAARLGRDEQHVRRSSRRRIPSASSG